MRAARIKGIISSSWQEWACCPAMPRALSTAGRPPCSLLGARHSLNPSHNHTCPMLLTSSSSSMRPHPAHPLLVCHAASTAASPGAADSTAPSKAPSRNRKLNDFPVVDLDDPMSTKRADGSSRRAPDELTAIGRAAAAQGAVTTVVLKEGKARLFQGGVPLVFTGAVDCVVGRPPPVAGDAVVVATYNLQPIAWGVYNPVSMYCVRILQREGEAHVDPDCILNIPNLVDRRIAAAVNMRAALALPSPATNVYRLVNSEGDRLSGLIVDVLGSCVVVQSSAAWTERYKDIIIAALQKHTKIEKVVWRPSAGTLKAEGVEFSSTTTNPAVAADSGGVTAVQSIVLDEGEGESSSTIEQVTVQSFVEVVENGIKQLATPEGQKTGFYADQRDSRAFLASVAQGKTVLDLCCFMGGFALAAAGGGATHATGVDSSAVAVSMAVSNAQLNGLQDRCTFVRSNDVSNFMKQAVSEGKQWDIVILDPPKLAPNRDSLSKATVKYTVLNEQALRLVAPGGLLMTCSCSAAMTQSSGTFRQVVHTAAERTGRHIQLIRAAGAAPDHPLDPACPEGEYLTNLTYMVGSSFVPDESIPRKAPVPGGVSGGGWSKRPSGGGSRARQSGRGVGRNGSNGGKQGQVRA